MHEKTWPNPWNKGILANQEIWTQPTPAGSPECMAKPTKKNGCPCWVYPMYPSHTMQLSKKVPTYPRYPKYKFLWKDFRNINRWWVGSGVCSFRGLLRTILEIALIEKIDWWDPERKKTTPLKVTLNQNQHPVGHESWVIMLFTGFVRFNSSIYQRPWTPRSSFAKHVEIGEHRMLHANICMIWRIWYVRYERYLNLSFRNAAIHAVITAHGSKNDLESSLYACLKLWMYTHNIRAKL